MGTWFEAKRNGKCAHCKKTVHEGDEMYAKRAGVFLCADCGTVAEATAPEVGEQEQAVLTDLDKLPMEASATQFAAGCIYMARQLDAGDVAPREVTNYMKEIRLNMLTLKDLYQVEDDDDETDIARQKAERRRREAGGY